MVDENQPNETLSFGDTPYSTDFELPPSMTTTHLNVADLPAVTMRFFDWIAGHRMGKLLFPTLFNEFNDRNPFNPDKVEALRLLVMAQFYMRHPKDERSTRGKSNVGKNVKPSIVNTFVNDRADKWKVIF